MSKLCVTCQDSINSLTDQLFSRDDEEIPDWFKEIGNYSLLPPPLNRNPNYNFYLNQPATSHPKKFNIVVSTNVKDILPNTKNTYVFFWGSLKRDYLNTKYPQPAKAYGDFSNCGVAKINGKGKVVFKFVNPTPYQYEGVKYPPHLHFVYLKKNRLWDDVCHTLIVTPNIKLPLFKTLLKSGKYLVLCALPQRFGFPIIKGSHRLSFEAPLNSIDEKITHFLSQKLLKNNDNIKNIPIITYCKNKECDAEDKLIEKLRKLGYINVTQFS